MSNFKHRSFLAIVCTLLFLVGCGSDQDFVFTNPASGSQTTTVRLEQTLLRAVPNAVSEQRFTGFDSGGNRVYGPETREKENPIVLETVPVIVTQLQIEYLVGPTVVGVATVPVALQPNVPFTIQNPEFSIVTAALDSLEVTPNSTLVEVGGTRQFRAVGLFAGEAEIDITNEVTWSSSSSSVAEIDPVSGLATANSSGTTVITATIEDLSAEATVEVIDEAITGLTITPAEALSTPGTTRRYSATISLEGGETRDATELVTWSSDSSDVEIGTNTGEAVIASGATTPSSVSITASLGEELQETAILNLGSYLYLAATDGLLGYRVDTANGSLSQLTSPDTTGQANSVVVHPSGRFAYAAIGTAIHAFTIDSQTGELTGIETENVAVAKLAMDPSGKYLFAATTVSVSVLSFTIDPATGSLQQIDTEAVPDALLLADLAVHPSGRTVYVSEGLDTKLHSLSVDPNTGEVTYVTFNPAPDEAAQITVDPLGRFLYLTIVDSEISIYTLDNSTGAVTGLLQTITLTEDDPVPHTGGNAIDPFGRFAYLTKDQVLSARPVLANGQPGTEVDDYDTVDAGNFEIVVDPSGRYIFWAAENVTESFGARGGIDQGTGAILNPTMFYFGSSVSVLDMSITP